MVHIVRKKIRNRYYLYVQESLYRNKQRSTRHIAYLGAEKNFTKEQIKSILDKYNGVGKNENKRIERQTVRS